jgi:hypothetical protein
MLINGIGWRLIHYGGSGAYLVAIVVINRRLLLATRRRRHEGDGYEPGPRIREAVFTSHEEALAAAMEKTVGLEEGWDVERSPRRLAVVDDLTVPDAQLIEMILRDGEEL